MMDNLTKLVANINIVICLRLIAIVLFLVGLATALLGVAMSLQSSSPNWIIIFYAFFQQLLRILFEPAILLAFAEIIKLLKDKQAK